MLSVHMVDGTPAPAPDLMQQMYQDVDAFNAEIRADGAWVFGGGCAGRPPVATATRRPP